MKYTRLVLGAAILGALSLSVGCGGDDDTAPAVGGAGGKGGSGGTAGKGGAGGAQGGGSQGGGSQGGGSQGGGSQGGGSQGGGSQGGGSQGGGSQGGGSQGGGSQGGGSQGGGSQGGAPNGGAPNGGAPNGGAPNGGAPNGGAPNGGAPNGGSPNGGAPNGGAPNGGAPNGGAPNGGAPNGGAPNGGAPNGGAPNGGAPNGGAPNGGAPNGGAPNGGAPNGGAPNGGAPNGGASNGGGGAGGTTSVDPNGPFTCNAGYCTVKGFKGYAFTYSDATNPSPRPPGGSSITPPCGETGPCFTGTTVCVAGTAGKVIGADFTNYWGAGVGLNLNQDIKGGKDSELNADMSGKTTVTVTLQGATVPSATRIVLQGADGKDYCGTLTNGVAMTLSSLKTDCWVSTGTTFAGGQAKQLKIQVPSNDQANVPFNFCVSKIDFN